MKLVVILLTSLAFLLIFGGGVI
ncbi:hypothetical protein AAS21_gp210 [Pantoea phage vB_PagS_AAS21]|uniref:Uncharacterized protein n=1 Tax=Pantoea phage vB_PagS_AAS21 TaxID=2575261 RepID=A0A4Y5P1V2_9CAUD|nr:hypothetical protein AAS21_gp210 [Pantoea phage vB_PagS_AAS21]